MLQQPQQQQLQYRQPVLFFAACRVSSTDLFVSFLAVACLRGSPEASNTRGACGLPPTARAMRHSRGSAAAAAAAASRSQQIRVGRAALSFASGFFFPHPPKTWTVALRCMLVGPQASSLSVLPTVQSALLPPASACAQPCAGCLLPGLTGNRGPSSPEAAAAQCLKYAFAAAAGAKTTVAAFAARTAAVAATAAAATTSACPVVGAQHRPRPISAFAVALERPFSCHSEQQRWLLLHQAQQVQQQQQQRDAEQWRAAAAAAATAAATSSIAVDREAAAGASGNVMPAVEGPAAADADTAKEAGVMMLPSHPLYYFSTHNALRGVDGEDLHFRVSFQELHGSRSCELDIYPFYDVQMVKRLLIKKLRLPASMQVKDVRLIFRGSELPNWRPMTVFFENPVKRLLWAVRGGSAQASIRPFARSQTFRSKELLRILEEVRLGFRRNVAPKLTMDGTGGTYILFDGRRRPVAVFKPEDEEAFAPCNPRGYEGRLGQQGLRGGVLSGEGAGREFAAYLLDASYGGFAGVPATMMVEACHPAFCSKGQIEVDGDVVMSSYVRSDPSPSVSWKVGSFQAFVEAKECVGNFDARLFSVGDVHRIAIFDLRVMNLDRNDSNILVAPLMGYQKEQQGAGGPRSLRGTGGVVKQIQGKLLRSVSAVGSCGAQLCLADQAAVAGAETAASAAAAVMTPDGKPTKFRLIPIDHGMILTDVLDVATLDLVWFDWPQSKEPYTESELRLIYSFDVDKDLERLTRRVALRDNCLRTLRLATKLLQICARHHLTVRQTATIAVRDNFDIPSPLEHIGDPSQQPGMRRGSFEAKIKKALKKKRKGGEPYIVLGDTLADGTRLCGRCGGVIAAGELGALGGGGSKASTPDVSSVVSIRVSDSGDFEDKPLVRSCTSIEAWHEAASPKKSDSIEFSQAKKDVLEAASELAAAEAAAAAATETDEPSAALGGAPGAQEGGQLARTQAVRVGDASAAATVRDRHVCKCIVTQEGSSNSSSSSSSSMADSGDSSSDSDISTSSNSSSSDEETHSSWISSDSGGGTASDTEARSSPSAPFGSFQPPGATGGPVRNLPSAALFRYPSRESRWARRHKRRTAHRRRNKEAAAAAQAAKGDDVAAVGATAARAEPLVFGNTHTKGTVRRLNGTARGTGCRPKQHPSATTSTWSLTDSSGRVIPLDWRDGRMDKLFFEVYESLLRQHILHNHPQWHSYPYNGEAIERSERRQQLLREGSASGAAPSVAVPAAQGNQLPPPTITHRRLSSEASDDAAAAGHLAGRRDSKLQQPLHQTQLQQTPRKLEDKAPSASSTTRQTRFSIELDA
ncbi:hypothetical protein Emag_004546 [Eimeria magna]